MKLFTSIPDWISHHLWVLIIWLALCAVVWVLVMRWGINRTVRRERQESQRRYGA